MTAALTRSPALAVTLVFVALSVASTGNAAVIRDLRIGSQRGYVRVVLESDRPLIPPPTVSVNLNRLRITIAGVINQVPLPDPETYHGDILGVGLSGSSDKPTIDASFSFNPVDIHTFALTGPHRYIIDAYRPTAAVLDDGPISPSELPTEEPPMNVEGDGALTKSLPATRHAASTEDGRGVLHRRSPFQQQLIVALIVITSIVAVLLCFLIWVGNRRKSDQPEWQNQLPPTNDPTIEDLDAAIREKLKSYDHI